MIYEALEPVPIGNLWVSEFGSFELTDQFVREAEELWPGEVHFGSESWVERLFGVGGSTEPRWYSCVAGPLGRLAREAYCAGVSIKRVKSIRLVLDVMESEL